jgi:hypothetical protein
MQMKINTLFDFFKTLLLAVIFCGGLIYEEFEFESFGLFFFFFY